MARNVKIDETPQLIEILDEDSPVFGEPQPVHPIGDDGRRRWIAPVAAAALVGLIIYGVLSSASEHSPPAAAPVTTGTIVHRTTVPAATTTAPPAPHVPYYAAEPPREYKLVSVDNQDQSLAYDTSGFQLWAKPGTSGADGAWFSLRYFFGPMGETMATNAYRVDTGNGHVLVSITAPGRLGLQLGDSSGTLDIESFGWNSSDLLTLARSVTIDAGVPSFPLSGLTDGYEMVSAIEPWIALEGRPIEQAFYATPDDPTSSIMLVVSPLPDMDITQIADARQVAMRVLLDHATTFTTNSMASIAGQMSGIAGQVIGGDNYSLATWIVDDHIVTVSAKMSVPQLIQVAQSVHTVSDGEFRGMQFQAIHNTSEANAANGRDNGATSKESPVSFGTDSAGRPWTIDETVNTFGGIRQIHWSWGGDFGGYDTSPTDQAQINTFVDSQRTIVLADLPRAIAATASLTITRDGADPIDVPFVDADPTLDRTFAAYAFSEDGPYAAQIVAPDGTILVSWPPS